MASNKTPPVPYFPGKDETTVGLLSVLDILKQVMCTANRRPVFVPGGG